MTSTALIVIDVQQSLFQPEPRPFEADAVIERINRLAAAARAAARRWSGCSMSPPGRPKDEFPLGGTARSV